MSSDSFCRKNTLVFPRRGFIPKGLLVTPQEVNTTKGALPFQHAYACSCTCERSEFVQLCLDRCGPIPIKRFWQMCFGTVTQCDSSALGSVLEARRPLRTSRARVRSGHRTRPLSLLNSSRQRRASVAYSGTELVRTRVHSYRSLPPALSSGADVITGCLCLSYISSQSLPIPA